MIFCAEHWEEGVPPLMPLHVQVQGPVPENATTLLFATQRLGELASREATGVVLLAVPQEPLTMIFCTLQVAVVFVLLSLHFQDQVVPTSKGPQNTWPTPQKLEVGSVRLGAWMAVPQEAIGGAILTVVLCAVVPPAPVQESV